MANENSGDGAAANTQSNQQTNSVNSGSTGSGQTSSDSLETIKSELQNLRKERDGFQELVGRWGNEVGEFRKKFEDIESRLSGLNSQENKSEGAANTQNNQEEREPPTKKELELIDAEWKKFNEEEKRILFANADGKTRTDKKSKITADLLDSLRSNTVLVPDSLLEVDQTVDPESKRNEHYTSVIHRAFAELDRSRNAVPSSVGSLGRTTPLTGSRNTQTLEIKENLQSGDGSLSGLLAGKAKTA